MKHDDYDDMRRGHQRMMNMLSVAGAAFAGVMLAIPVAVAILLCEHWGAINAAIGRALEP